MQKKIKTRLLESKLRDKEKEIMEREKQRMHTMQTMGLGGMGGAQGGMGGAQGGMGFGMPGTMPKNDIPMGGKKSTSMSHLMGKNRDNKMKTDNLSTDCCCDPSNK